MKHIRQNSVDACLELFPSQLRGIEHLALLRSEFLLPRALKAHTQRSHTPINQSVHSGPRTQPIEESSHKSHPTSGQREEKSCTNGEADEQNHTLEPMMEPLQLKETGVSQELQIRSIYYVIWRF